jgi:hypothetical protein
MNNSRESIKNRDYFLKFKTKVKKPLDTESMAWVEFIPEQIRSKKSHWTVPLNLKVVFLWLNAQHVQFYL